MNYCASLARSGGAGGDQLNERRSTIAIAIDNDNNNNNNNDNNGFAREHSKPTTTNRVCDLLKLTHLNLNDSQPDSRSDQISRLSHLFEGAVEINHCGSHNSGSKSEPPRQRSAEMLTSLGEQREEALNQMQQINLQSPLVEASSMIALVEHDESNLGDQGDQGDQYNQQRRLSMQTSGQNYDQQHYGFPSANFQSVGYPAIKAEQRSFLSLDGDFGPLLAHQETALHSGGFEFAPTRAYHHHNQQQQQHQDESLSATPVAYVSGSPLAVDHYKNEPACVYTSLDHASQYHHHHHHHHHHQPHTLNLDCSLPDAVIRLNYQQEAVAVGHQSQHGCSQCLFNEQQQQQQQLHPFHQIQQQMPLHYKAGGSYHSEPSLINLESINQQRQQHLQQQDSGHVSSVSCMDSAGSESALLVDGHHLNGHRSDGDNTQAHTTTTTTTTATINLDGRHLNEACPMQLSGSLVSGHSICSNHLLSLSNNNNQHNQHQHQHHHHRHHHNEPELKLCEWEGCENTFLDMNEFVRHLEECHVNQAPKEKNRYYCLWSNCKRNEQEFNARYKLLIHMRVHSGEKPYPCSNDNCKKSFSRLENLKIHVRSHTGEKPYKCSFDNCSKSFTNSSDRIKHHKTHKDPKPYSCNYANCAKRYTDPSSLRKHLRAHKRANQLQTTGVSQMGVEEDEIAAAELAGVQLPSAGVICEADFDPTSLLQSSHSQLVGAQPQATGYEETAEEVCFIEEQQHRQRDSLAATGGSCDFNHHHYSRSDSSKRFLIGRSNGSKPFIAAAAATKRTEQQQQQQQLDSRYSRSWFAGADSSLGDRQAAQGAAALAGTSASRPACDKHNEGSAAPTFACCQGGKAGRLTVEQRHDALSRSLPPPSTSHFGRATDAGAPLPSFGGGPLTVRSVSKANLSPESGQAQLQLQLEQQPLWGGPALCCPNCGRF